MNKNDNKILELKKLIEVKKEELSKVQAFIPVTNCVIELEDKRINIHTRKENELKLLAIKLHSMLESAKTLGYEDLLISGYSLEDWLTDINNKIGHLNIKNKKAELKTMEEKLTQMLSNEKKIELELEEISNFLK